MSELLTHASPPVVSSQQFVDPALSEMTSKVEVEQTCYHEPILAAFCGGTERLQFSIGQADRGSQSTITTLH